LYSFLRGISALFIVLALILVASYAMSRYGKKSPLLAGASLGTLLGRVYLTPKACLYFVRVADKVLVVGVTPATVSSVAVLDGAGFEMPRAQAPSAVPASRSGFHAMLKSAKPPAPANVPESDDPEIAGLRGEIARLRDELQESSREIGA
jgi:flagellar biogenesis protein FliO